MILDPNSSLEGARATLLRCDVEHKAADRAQELPPDIFQIVGVAIERAGHDQHLFKTFGQILHGINLFEAAPDRTGDVGGFIRRIQERTFSNLSRIEVELPEKIPVSGWMKRQLIVFLDSLNVGFHEWMHLLHCGGQCCFFCGDPIDDLVYRGVGACGFLGVRRPRHRLLRSGCLLRRLGGERETRADQRDDDENGKRKLVSSHVTHNLFFIPRGL